ncbi:S8 family serine peptidase [Winkia neuii]|uniref:Peptidase S8/S53 domain-containing protein n=1 Tax=Winkia neuii TaxID=33007 RepID=A0A2I1IN32_9ACTO|nr:S8 family serine peptidase [Winkia neuii]MDK8100067.1 S8 family serine peptidase [Winkia neuii]OFJ69514.1 hypothetical protein HMPREF2851_00990 [Actinomyces sp. HMSC064C12]PKY72533.1 hypothetical protein CYJ19_06745 [Winkia neuii]
MKIPQKGMYIPRAALVVGVGLSLCAGATFASATPRVNDITPNLSAPLQKEIAASGNSAKQPVIIEMTAKADVAEAKAEAADDALSQRKAVIGALTETATESQTPLLDVLKKYEKQGKAKNVESFYIVNAIAAELSGSLIKQISHRTDVKSVRLNKELHQDQPIVSPKEKTDKSGIEWGISAIGAPRVWDELKIDGKGVTVGIIDSGTNYKHPAIATQFNAYDKDYGLFGVDRSYKDFVTTDRAELTDPSHDHGTHVAGTIVGKAGSKNQIGVAPGAKYVAARAIGTGAGDEADMLRAAEWIMKPGGRAENAPRVVNNSWGGDSEKSDWFAPIVTRWREAGIFPVFAAGNTNDYPADGSIANPGNLPGVFSVAACDRAGKLADFSRVGPSPFSKQQVKPDICAPGVNVRSALAGGGYAAWSGTSMAAPHVTGTVALMLQANPKLTVEQIEQILRSTAIGATDLRYPKSPNMGYGYGNLNAYDAVRKAKALKDGKQQDDTLTITGRVLQKGSDREDPTIEPIWPKLAFAGQAIKLAAKVADDTALTSVKAYYRNGKAGAFAELPMRQLTGTARKGNYEANIPASAISAKQVQVKIVAKDFAGKEVGAAKVHTIEVKPGIRPGEYANDFEDNVDGWQFSGSSAAGPVAGDWNWSSPAQPNEPAPIGKKLIGTRVGHRTPTRQIDSYATMPPLDLSGLRGKKPALAYDEYLGFNGVTTAKIQVSTSENGKWEDLDEKLIPPGTSPAWKRVYYSLEKWAGHEGPIFVRFAFRYPDHGTGAGWYIDNVSVDAADKLAPSPVTSLQGTQRGPGVELNWSAVADNDVTGYAIYRGKDLATAQKIATVDKDAAKLAYLDTTLEIGQKAVYAVRPVDSFGNEAAVEKSVSLTRAKLENVASYSGTAADAFTTGTIEGRANDWQAGVPLKVADSSSTLPLRQAQLGLREKIARGDSVWGTNLGRPIAGSDLADARVSRQQHSYVQTPFLIPTKGSVLEFESYNAQQYLGEYQDNLSSVEVVKQDGTATTLLDAAQIMDNGTKFTFRWIQADLDKYAGQSIALRFVQKTGKNVVNDYELGWYLDNIRVGAPSVPVESGKDVAAQIIAAGQKFTPQSFAEGAKPAQVDTVPVPGARVEVTQLDRKVPVNEADGSFNLNISTGTWTVKASAYGFVSQQRQVSQNANLEFVLEKAVQSDFAGKVLDAGGAAVPGAHVRVVEDANIAPAKVEASGAFVLPGVYREGKVTLRAFAPGYKPADLVVGSDEAVTGHVFKLEKLAGSSAKVSYDNGTARTNVVHNKAGRGVAVRFYPAKTPATLASVDAYVQKTNTANRDVKVLVLAEDENQRLQTLAQLDKVKLKDGWNNIDLSGYAVPANSTFYVAVVQNHPGPDAVGVAVDTQGTNAQATRRTYLFNGAFTPALDANVVGAGMIRANLTYAEGATDSIPEPVPGQKAPEKVAEASQNDFEWEVFADHAVVKKFTGKYKKVEVPAYYVDPASNAHLPVTVLASNAFAWKYLESLKLPEGLTTIEPKALTFAIKKEGTLHVPSTVKELQADSLAQTGAQRITGMAGITHIPAGAFTDTHGAIIDMPNVKSIDPQAFRMTREPWDADYNQILTAPTNPAKLTSVDKLYLVNPAQVEVSVEMVGSEKQEKFATYLGPDFSGTSYSYTRKASDFYQLGQEVTISAPRNKLVSYLEETKKVTLKSRLTKVNFLAVDLKGNVREPLVEGDTSVLGTALPGGTVQVSLCGDGIVDRSCTDLPAVNTDKLGQYRIDLPQPLLLGLRVKVVTTDKAGKSYERDLLRVVEKSKAPFLMAPNSRNILLRYLGEGGPLDFPSSAPDKNGTVRPVNKVGEFALAGRSVTEANNLGKLGTLSAIGDGAFADNALKRIEFPVNLRQIGVGAFARNQLQEVALPSLMHKVGAGAFADNQIGKLTAGKYTNHYGAYAFANNQLQAVHFGSRIEEIGEGAFANNQLTSVEFEPPVAIEPQANIRLFSDKSTEIAAKAFANNRLVEVSLPARIGAVADDSFAGNGRFVNLISDNQNIRDSVLAPSSGHIVNGASATLRFLDEAGKPVARDQVWVGPGLVERTGADAGAFYRIGQEYTVQAPQIAGYQIVTKQVKFAANKAAGTIVELKYKKLSDPEKPVVPENPVVPEKPQDQPSPSEGDPTSDSGKVTPGGHVVIPGKPSAGKPAVVEGQGEVHQNSDGSLRVDASKKAKPAGRIVVELRGKDGKVHRRIAVRVVANPLASTGTVASVVAVLAAVSIAGGVVLRARKRP